MFRDRPLCQFHPFQQLMLLVSFCFVFMAVFSLLGLVIAAKVFHLGDFQELSASGLTMTAENAEVFRFLQGILSTGVFIVPSLVFYYYDSHHRLKPLLEGVKVKAAVWPILVLMLLSLLPIISLIYDWNQHLKLPAGLSEVELLLKEAEKQAEEQTRILLAMPNMAVFITNLFVLAIIPAIGEEFLFRGCLQRILLRGVKNPHVAIWVTGFLFSALHMQFYGFFPRFFLGVALGYVFWFSGSIWTSVLIHALNNGMAVVMGYFEQKGVNAFSEKAMAGLPVLYYVVAFIVFGLSFWGIYKLRSDVELELAYEDE